MARKQQEIPGTETPEPPKALVTLGREYKRVQRLRMKWLAKEIELKGDIIDKMHELGATHMKDEDEDIEFELKSAKDKLVVRAPSEAGGSDEEE